MNTVQDTFLKEGLLGAIIVALAIVVVFLYKENKNLSNDNRELAEKRVNDLVVMKDTYFNNAQAMKEAYFSNLDSLKDIVQNVLIIVQALKEKIK